MHLSANISRLRLVQPLYEAMLLHLEAVYPEEGCGLLAGHRHNETATTLYAIPNQSRSLTEYLMDPVWQLNAFLEIERNDLALLAIYHSHPQGPATPSLTDLAQAYYPDLVQLIISLADQTRPGVRAFWLTPTAFNEIALVVE